MGKNITRYSGLPEEIFARLMNDEEFRTIAANHLMAEVYSLIKPETDFSSP